MNSLDLVPIIVAALIGGAVSGFGTWIWTTHTQGERIARLEAEVSNLRAQVATVVEQLHGIAIAVGGRR